MTASSVALIVQIHLQQNRTELALKEVNAAKRWAQDSLLVNLAESWVGLRLVRMTQETDAQADTLIFRVERNTNRHTTSMKSWHKLLQPRRRGR